jgi:membrane protein implicated in regulation of membrane protease activity
MWTPTQKRYFKTILIILLVIITLPLLYKGLLIDLKLVAFVVIAALAYYVGWPWLKKRFGKD